MGQVLYLCHKQILMNFKSLPELLDHFKEEKTCIEYYEKLRWNGNPVCPHCGIDKKPYKTNRGYKCSDSDCGRKFTVKVGTIFENSKIPFRIWFAAIYLCTAHKKGISSVQLSIDLNITQKTAWFVLHRVREMLKGQAPQMIGGKQNMVESDETYIGGKEINKHFKKKRSDDESQFANDGTPYKAKKVVVGIIERDGKVILKHIPAGTKENMVAFLNKHVPKGTTVYTDKASHYKQLGKTYRHGSVDHALRVYVAGEVHTNTIENFWSVLKRGLYGIYHQVSDKHLERYLNEFSARFNARKTSECEKFNTFLAQSEGRLLYRDLIAND